MNDGLPEEWRCGIKKILAGFPQVQSAVIFGSRAMGNFRDPSDLDLALEGQGLRLEHLLSILVQVRELNLPIELDLVIRDTIENPDFEQHIREFGKVWYRRNAGVN